MPTERLSMRKTREILRLKWQQGRTHREIARALAIGAGTPSSSRMRWSSLKPSERISRPSCSIASNPLRGSRSTTKTRSGVGRSRLATVFPGSRGAR